MLSIWIINDVHHTLEKETGVFIWGWGGVRWDRALLPGGFWPLPFFVLQGHGELLCIRWASHQVQGTEYQLLAFGKTFQKTVKSEQGWEKLPSANTDPSPTPWMVREKSRLLLCFSMKDKPYFSHIDLRPPCGRGLSPGRKGDIFSSYYCLWI